MPKDTLFSPPYFDEDGRYGRDFYRESLGFGRVREVSLFGEANSCIEVSFPDTDGLDTAYMPTESAAEAVDRIAFDAEALVRYGNLAAAIRKFSVE